VTIPESPSALLHRAADRLEELAGAVVADDATRLDLPWHIERCANEEAGDCPCIIAQAENGEGGAPPTAMFYVADAETPELAAYIAVVDPPTGHAFAAMLRAAAVMAKGLPEAEDVAVVRAGMDAAHSILGEA